MTANLHLPSLSILTGPALVMKLRELNSTSFNRFNPDYIHALIYEVANRLDPHMSTEPTPDPNLASHPRYADSINEQVISLPDPSPLVPAFAINLTNETGERLDFHSNEERNLVIAWRSAGGGLRSEFVVEKVHVGRFVQMLDAL